MAGMSDAQPTEDAQTPPPDAAAGGASAHVHPGINTDERWKFLRDVAVFEFKMFLDNVRDFALMPASLIAAGLDLVLKSEKEGSRFYRVLNWGKQSEEIINVYGAIDEDAEGHTPGHDYTVDAVVARIESVIVREYEKGGTAASVKAAVDKALNQIQRETGARRARTQATLKRAMEKMRLSDNDLPPKV